MPTFRACCCGNCRTPRRAVSGGGWNPKVVVGQILQTPDSQFADGAYPPEGSVITAAIFGTKEYPIRTLLDLKKALNENRGEKIVRLKAYRANGTFEDDGEMVPIRSARTGAVFLDSSEESF